MSIFQEIRRNRLAIISLLVAFSALGYNTWRNELTEANRTIRQSGFEMLVHVGQLQRITYLAHYDKDFDEGNPRKGWAEVLLLTDLATLMPGEVQVSAGHLAETWGKNWDDLGQSDTAVRAIDASIDEIRVEVLRALIALD